MAMGKMRKSMFSVMNNTGYGDLVIIKNNMKVTVPQKIVKKKKGLYSLTLTTVGDAEYLWNHDGISVEKMN